MSPRLFLVHLEVPPSNQFSRIPLFLRIPKNGFSAYFGTLLPLPIVVYARFPPGLFLLFLPEFMVYYIVWAFGVGGKFSLLLFNSQQYRSSFRPDFWW